MSKQLVFDVEARRHLKTGVDVLAEAVKTTLGPKGRNVALDQSFGTPTVSHDGVTVAKEIDLEDPFENMGAQLLKEAATKTNDVAGDGTTTATVIAQTIVNEGLRNLAAGANPMILKRGLARGAESVVRAVRDMAVAVQGREDIANIAAISANDPEIGRLIADVMDRVGKDGVITVEESRGLQFEIDYVEGMEFDRGYISPYFVTNQDTMRTELEDPYVLITEQKLTSVQELVPLLEKLMQSGKKELVVIAEDVEGEGLATLVVNKLRGILDVVAVKAPGYGDRRKELLKDIAVLTGGQVISEEVGRKLDSVQLYDLGRARPGRVRQGQYDDYRRARQAGGHPGAHAADPHPARRDHLGLRPGEAARAAGEDVRRCGGGEGRSSDRDGAEGEEAPRGRCPVGHPRGG